MTKSEMSTPARHAGLGLKIYTQATSPIRRYSDLLTHFQLKAHLRAIPSQVSNSEVMLSLTTATQEVTLVERQTNRYWEYPPQCRSGLAGIGADVAPRR